MKKFLALFLIFMLASSVSAAELNNVNDDNKADNFPEHDIEGVIQWAQGGVTDILTRALCEAAQKYLGKNIIMQNITGNTGANGLEYVYKKAADGYTLLLGAENPALYKALRISNQTYDDFECVYLIGDVTAGVVVRPDSKYSSFSDIIADSKSNPGKIKYAMTGRGGLQWVMAAFVNDVTGATFQQVEYSDNNAAKNAVLNGECDFSICLLQQCIDDYQKGTLKILCVFSAVEATSLQGVPTVVDEYPGFLKYFPWGAFYGVFVRKGTPQPIIDKLSDAFSKASLDENFKKVLTGNEVNFLGYTGRDAVRYIHNWNGNTIDALITSGALN